jgi:hypothetical protein
LSLSPGGERQRGLLSERIFWRGWVPGFGRGVARRERDVGGVPIPMFTHIIILARSKDIPLRMVTMAMGITQKVIPSRYEGGYPCLSISQPSYSSIVP